MTDSKSAAPKPAPVDASIAELDTEADLAYEARAAGERSEYAKDQLDDQVDELVQGTTSERDQALERAQACSNDLQKILAKHRCRIMPRLDPATAEPVGLAGDKLQLTATFFIAPLP